MEKKCPVCNSDIIYQPSYEDLTAFYECPICGRFELSYPTQNLRLNLNHLSFYLAHNCFKDSNCAEYRYHTVKDREYCDKYRKEFDAGHNTCGRPIHMDSEMIEAWQPKTFSERIDRILLYMGKNTRHIGQSVSYSFDELCSMLFIDRWEYTDQCTLREPDSYADEVDYMLNYLQEQSYITAAITFPDVGSDRKIFVIQLTPKGYARVDELQKNTSHGRSVLVAMKFGEDTNPLREAIRQGIADAGYVAILIDEVQHNDFITPELLKHIRDSKFVVVDLTHQNNGAYFEEGYAMGLGKPVIQLCKKDTKLHFDIAQKNTIIWESEADIPERLCNRIKATIE